MHYNQSFDFFPSQFYSNSNSVSASRSHSNRAVPTSHLLQQSSVQNVSYVRLVRETAMRMQQLAARGEPIPDSYAKRNSLNGKFELRASEWTLITDRLPLAQLRMVHIQGSRNEIINTWVFPNRPNQMPVYAAELIAVGNTTKVAFVDIQVPVLRKEVAYDVAAVASAIAPRFSCLPCDQAPPDWATHDSQGFYTYSRDIPSQQSSTIEECYLTYLDTYLAMFASDTLANRFARSERNETAVKALHSYQLHHMEHSPGNKFLSKLFGSDWTEAFMTNFLFAEPRG